MSTVCLVLPFDWSCASVLTFVSNKVIEWALTRSHPCSVSNDDYSRVLLMMALPTYIMYDRCFNLKNSVFYSFWGR